MMHELVVDGAEFAKSIRLLVRTSGDSAASEFTLRFEDGEIVADVAGASVSIPARGTWSGVVTVHRRALAVLATIAGGPTPIVITEDGMLRVGGLSFTCRFTPLTHLNLDLALDPSLLQVLRLRRDHTDEELLAAGLLDQVEQAERELDRMIESSANRLQEVGNFLADIREMVRREVYG
jgi:hypothetical protein